MFATDEEFVQYRREMVEEMMFSESVAGEVSNEPVPRWKQRLGGALIAAIGGGGTAWIWHVAKIEGEVYLKASVLLPAFLVLGLALVAIPGYKEERLARGEDISELSGAQLLTRRWWAVLVIALAAGVGNLLLLRDG